MDLIYWLFGKRIKRQLAANDHRPKGLHGLTFAFSGPDGRAYYTWSSIDELPWNRSRRISRLLSFADSGSSRKTQEHLVGLATQVLMNEVIPVKDEARRAKSGAKAVAILQELVARGRDIIPEDIYHEMAATLICAEDESPDTVDPATTNRKAEMLRTAGRAGVPFSEQIRCLSSIIGSALTTKDAYGMLLGSWILEEASRKAILEALTTEPPLPQPNGASMN